MYSDSKRMTMRQIEGNKLVRAVFFFDVGALVFTEKWTRLVVVEDVVVAEVVGVPVCEADGAIEFYYWLKWLLF